MFQAKNSPGKDLGRKLTPFDNRGIFFSLQSLCRLLGIWNPLAGISLAVKWAII